LIDFCVPGGTVAEVVVALVVVVVTEVVVEPETDGGIG
jgi:hypothetical protein